MSLEIAPLALEEAAGRKVGYLREGGVLIAK